MYIPSKNNSIVGTPNWIQTLDGLKRQTAHELNCMRIGIVQNIYYDDLTVDVLIANKKTLNLNNDGTQNVRDFPLIRAKIVYCNPFITCPINQGDECVLLFSDREIESWFINGEVNPEGYPRMHALTDCVAIFGIRSIPKMISILADCLNLFYGSSNIALSSDHININADTVQASNFHATNGATGALVDSNGKKLADVVDGIITEIS
ncbi:MAG: hypothetical protein II244_07810 [Clostridia bacterium]|nr:hypothetical protein [Clostridia bacterium]